MESIVNAIKAAKRVYVCGNGGSASTANHFVNDLVKMSGIRAYSLCANEALLTALANDNGYENVFIDQLRVYAEEGDLIIAITTSGKSENILKVKEWAEKKGIDYIEFPILQKSVEITTQFIEEQHLQKAHSICEAIRV